MGSILSTVVYQPLLLGTASTLMIVALIYQNKSVTCGTDTTPYGSEIFKLEMGIATVLVISSVIISFLSALTV